MTFENPHHLYLRITGIIDHDHPEVLATARMLAGGREDDEAIARVCFEFVRDRIRHSGDHRDGVVTCRASEVLEALRKNRSYEAMVGNFPDRK